MLKPPSKSFGRLGFYLFASATLVIVGVASMLIGPQVWWSYVLFGPMTVLGLHDALQTHRTILRNYPLVGRFRYMLEGIRPEIQQYFVEQNLEGRPLNREERSLVYARSKQQLSTLPFGTKRNVYDVGYEWINHSMAPKPKRSTETRVRIGGPDCKKPYDCSLLNISAMSFGSLSRNAILALSRGAQKGGFFHNTGEGSVSPYHLEGGAALCWQIGTGYFGCRNEDGTFNDELFAATAILDNVRLIEIKLSQGAKPGKGGILPAAKITDEISRIRIVPLGKDVISPASHSEFDTPTGLLRFVKRLRDLSGGKPVGFKLCVGKRRELFAVCKAMLETGIKPDFITVDGGEGGTGAAPLEFSNSVGTPLVEGLVTVHNALVGFGIRQDIRIIASGRVMTAFGMAKRLALGADTCNAARAFMLSLGCIQALRCNMNDCPAGVATQDQGLMNGLVVTDKAERVYSFHKQTIKTLHELIAATGLEAPESLRPWHILRRVSPHEVQHYGEMYPYVEPGALLATPLPADYARAMNAAAAHTFAHIEPDDNRPRRAQSP
jgi:glutamate synthase domain-containing protein 2